MFFLILSGVHGMDLLSSFYVIVCLIAFSKDIYKDLLGFNQLDIA